MRKSREGTYDGECPSGGLRHFLQGEIVGGRVFPVPHPLIQGRQIPEPIDAAVARLDLDLCRSVDAGDTLDNGQRMSGGCIDSVDLR